MISCTYTHRPHHTNILSSILLVRLKTNIYSIMTIKFLTAKSCRLRELVMDREAWHAAVHGVTKSRTWLRDWTEVMWYAIFTFPFPNKFLFSLGFLKKISFFHLLIFLLYSFPGEGHGNLLHFPCLENPMDRWRLAGCSLWGCKKSDMTEACMHPMY